MVRDDLMTTITISKLKATCLAVLERVRKTGEPVLVTKRGEPIAQILPAPDREPGRESAFGCMAGTAEELADILQPLPAEPWDALR
jgi:prevent-host-death family protein